MWKKMLKTCLVSVNLLSILFNSTLSVAATTDLVSVSKDGTQGNNRSIAMPNSMSADAEFIVFNSSATNLLTADLNGIPDCLVKNTSSGELYNASVDSDDNQSNGNCGSMSLDDSGNIIVFSSFADNLTLDDTNGLVDIFIRNRTLGTTTRVSNSNAGELAQQPVISGNGNVIIYTINDKTQGILIYKLMSYDISTGAHTVEATSSPPANYMMRNLSVTKDGRFIVFSSRGVDGQIANSAKYVWVKDRLTGEFDYYYSGFDLESMTGTLSDDGRYLVRAGRDNVGASDPEYVKVAVFLHDRVLETTNKISLPSYGLAHSSENLFPSISGDGRYVVFESAGHAIPRPEEYGNNIYVYDQQSVTLEQIGHGLGGSVHSWPAGGLEISENGRHVKFSTNFDLIPEDINNYSDVMIIDRAIDNDGDSFGNFLDIEVDDCNDSDPLINPGATEITNNGIDENCNGMGDDIDNDYDDYGASVDCDDNDASIYPSAPETKHDGVDQDCNDYDLTIDVSTTYKSNKDQLKVKATSDLGATANLSLDGFGPMTYSKNIWSIVVDSAGGNPGTVSVTGVEGTETVTVQ